MKIELRIQHYHGQTDGQTDRQTDTQSGFLSSLSELKILKYFTVGRGGSEIISDMLFKVMLKIHFGPFCVILERKYGWKLGGPILGHI